MGFSTEAPSTLRTTAAPDGFTGLLGGFRARLDRALAAWLAAKREEAIAAGSPETAELIDGVGQLATEGGSGCGRPSSTTPGRRAAGVVKTRPCRWPSPPSSSTPIC